LAPHLYVKLVGPGAPLELTRGDSANDYAPAWSPDGSTIAFFRQHGAVTMSLVTIPALGGPETVLGEGSGTPLFVTRLSWSADSKWILTPGIRAIAVASREVRQLTSPPAGSGDASPVLSPDGRTLAYSRTHSSVSEIMLMPVTPDLRPGGEAHVLAHLDVAVTSLAWLPNSNEILYATGNAIQNFANGLWRVRLSDGIPHRPQGIGAAATPAVSRPRDPLHLPRLAYVLPIQDQNVWKLPVSNGKPGEPVRLIASTRQDKDPRFSADGSKIAFMSDRSGLNEVWTANADGSNQVQLTFLKGGMNSPGHWSPDGRKLALLSTETGKQEIYVVDAGGGPAIRLTNDKVHNTAPSWSRDGKWIYFGSNRSGRVQVWKMPPQPNATPVQVTQNGGYAAIESWDGTTLYYAQRGQAPGIWKTPVEGGAETQIIPAINTWGDFDVTRDGIVFLTPAPYEIRFYSFATGKTTTIAALPRRPDFGLAVSPADGSIAYTLVDQESSEIMMVENFR